MVNKKKPAPHVRHVGAQHFAVQEWREEDHLAGARLRSPFQRDVAESLLCPLVVVSTHRLVDLPVVSATKRQRKVKAKPLKSKQHPSTTALCLSCDASAVRCSQSRMSTRPTPRLRWTLLFGPSEAVVAAEQEQMRVPETESDEEFFCKIGVK
jgi:hypothetical protein